MSILESILLGIVQGLTEFLPVSSSGHLVIASNILGLKPDLAFITMVHLATLLAVIVYFFKDIVLLIRSFLRGLLNVRQAYYEPNFRISALIIIGSIPTAMIALLFKDQFEKMFSSLFAVGCFLIVTGCLLLAAEKFSSAKKSEKQMNMLDSIIIGIFQGLAIAPGISRSGATVSASLLRGLNRPLAAKFSFLLSIPAIIGAFIYELKDIADLSFNRAGLVPLILGMIAAFISGYFAIKVFISMIKNKKISVFSYYLFAVGIIVVIRTMA